MSYIVFRDVGFSDSGKTRRTEVVTLDSKTLGWVYWHSPWRKYIYHAAPGTIYDEACMNEIAGFVKDQTATHKEKKGKGKE